MSDSTLIHTYLRAVSCNCGFKFEPFPAEEDGRDAKRGRLLINVHPELPEDILVEILLRLPVKSLIRFTVVCKFWYDLIPSPKFTALHDTNSKIKSLSLYCHSYNRNNPATISFRLFDIPMNLKIPASIERVEIVGCSNGLVCICLTRRHNMFALWNPATTKSRLLFEKESCRPKNGYIYSGFCFDSVSRTYKIAKLTFKETLFMVQVPEGSAYVIFCVFTLNANSWRRNDLLAPCRFPNGGAMSDRAYIIDRYMYWIVSGGYMVQGVYILCFDMVDEVFKIIEAPPCDVHLCCTHLLDYKGSLAMFVWDPPVCSSGCRFDMWVLDDEDGTNRSWCKQLTLTPSMDNILRLGFFSKGDVGNVVVLHTNGRCLFWDIDSGETTAVISKMGCIFPFFLYSESFASVY